MCEACDDIWLENLSGEISREEYLIRVEKRVLRMMCGMQLADGVSTKELMVSLGLKSTIFKVAKKGIL